MGKTITISNLYEDLRIRLSQEQVLLTKVRAARTHVESALNDGKAHYGINTGFGVLAQKRINNEQVSQLQKNLILSHSVGVGSPIPKHISELILKFKIHSLSLGYSGISENTFQRLLLHAKNDWIPVIPEKGSVGASGDLAPLAHMTLPFLGLGEIWDENGREALPTQIVYDANGIVPVELQAKDGLSLINGTQFMLAYGAFVAHEMLHLIQCADIISAMSLEALQGSIRPFDQRIHLVRPHKGAQEVAANIRLLLTESEILESHRECGKVQDPYCLRCIPQVHGASRAALYHAIEVFETEINSVTDNPLVFEDGDIVSGGNFHGQPLALVLDYMGIALAELASISERRTFLLLDGHDGLPRLLMNNTGINTGFMIPQYTSAALVSENKVLAHPASVDSIPTSLGQEDHVSMGSISATKLYRIYENLIHVLSIELLVAAQALDYRLPTRPGRGIEKAHEFVRERIPHAEDDHLFSVDMRKCREIVESAGLVDQLNKHNMKLQ